MICYPASFIKLKKKNKFLSMQWSVFTNLNSGGDLLRVWYGPLPAICCKLILIFKSTFGLMISFNLTAIVTFKFMFICVWKSMRQINDDLITRIVIRCSFAVSLFLSTMKGLTISKTYLVSTTDFYWNISMIKFKKYSFLGQTVLIRNYEGVIILLFLRPD